MARTLDKISWKFKYRKHLTNGFRKIIRKQIQKSGRINVDQDGESFIYLCFELYFICSFLLLNVPKSSSPLQLKFQWNLDYKGLEPIEKLFFRHFLKGERWK